MAPYGFVDKISRGIAIDQFGDGTSCRDYTFIADIVDGVLAALDNPQPCEVYNLGNNRTVMLKEFINVIEEAVGKKAIINLKPDQPGDVPITYADLSKSQAMLGYDPKVDIQTGIGKLVEWYQSKSSDPRLLFPQSTPRPLTEELSDIESTIDSDDGSKYSEAFEESKTVTEMVNVEASHGAPLSL